MPKLGRNAPCHCGSGTKYKKCHGAPPPARKVSKPTFGWLLSVAQTPDDDPMTVEEFEMHTASGAIFPAEDTDGKWLLFKEDGHAYVFGEDHFPGKPCRAIRVTKKTPEMADYFFVPQDPYINSRMAAILKPPGVFTLNEEQEVSLL